MHTTFPRKLLIIHCIIQVFGTLDDTPKYGMIRPLQITTIRIKKRVVLGANNHERVATNLNTLTSPQIY